MFKIPFTDISIQNRYWGSVIFILLTAIIFSKCTNQAGLSQQDFYYSRGRKIILEAPRDSIGIVLLEKLPLDTLKKKLKELGYNFARQLSPYIVIVLPDNNQVNGKKDLIKAASDLPVLAPDLIEKAGYVTYRVDGKFPLIITTDLILEFKKGTADKEISAFFSKYKLDVLSANPYLKNQYQLRANANFEKDAVKASRKLAEDSIVLYAHPDFITVKKYQTIDPNTNPYYKFQWFHQNTGQKGGTPDADTDMELAWDYATGSPATIIAILDEGFDTLHQDLKSNFSFNRIESANGYNETDDDGNSYKDDLLGWNFRGCGSNDPQGCGRHQLDASAHGTAVMGMAVAAQNSLGVIGSCPDCGVLPLEAGSINYQDIKAFNYARSRGAKIINCSWLYEEDEVPEGIEACINSVAESGITIFFAIDNIPGIKCVYPRDISSLYNVISIASSTNKDLFWDPVSGTNNSGNGDSMDLLSPGASNHGNPGFNTMWITTTDLSGPAGNNNGGNEFCGTTVDADYLACWDGTSFATPLAAGVAGLIVSLDNTVSPKQIQYLLQDCADKIQPEAGSYSPQKGISMPSGKIPTHGYGRLNAYEAVKIAASSGQAGMDIFLRDNYLDWGNTEQPSNTLFTSPRDFIPHWKSEDIKVDAPPFETDAAGVTVIIDNNRKFEDHKDENPIGGVKNRVYVRIRNRGYHTVPVLTCNAYWVYAGLSMPSLPPDFWDRFPKDPSNISVWHPLGSRDVDNLVYSGESIAGSADDDGSRIVMFEFDAPVPDITQVNHYCLMALVSTMNDPMPTSALRGSMEKLNMDFVTSHFNNATHRNYIIVDGTQKFSDAFYLYNPLGYAIDTRIITKKTGNIAFSFRDSVLSSIIHLKKGERKMISFRATPSNDSVPQELEFRQMLITRKGNKTTERIMGGLTYRVAPR